MPAQGPITTIDSSSSSGGKSASRPAGRAREGGSPQRRARGSTVWRRDSAVGETEPEPLPWQPRQAQRAKYARPAGLGVYGAAPF